MGSGVPGHRSADARAYYSLRRWRCRQRLRIGHWDRRAAGAWMTAIWRDRELRRRPSQTAPAAVAWSPANLRLRLIAVVRPNRSSDRYRREQSHRGNEGLDVTCDAERRAAAAIVRGATWADLPILTVELSDAGGASWIPGSAGPLRPSRQALAAAGAGSRVVKADVWQSHGNRASSVCWCQMALGEFGGIEEPAPHPFFTNRVFDAVIRYRGVVVRCAERRAAPALSAVPAGAMRRTDGTTRDPGARAAICDVRAAPDSPGPDAGPRL